MRSLHLRLLIVFPLLLAASAWGQVSAVNSPDGKPLSQRVVAYWIDASVNTDAKSLDASEILEYRNPSVLADLLHFGTEVSLADGARRNVLLTPVP